VPLARGWEWQIEAANNPLSYQETLTAGSYRLWLAARAVGWVAIPDAPLDYAAAAEGRLIARGQPYLRSQWRGTHWTRYRVTDRNPLATGSATVTGLTDSAVLLQATRAGPVVVRTPFTGSLVLLDADGHSTGCLAFGPHTTTVLRVPTPGSYRLQGQWLPGASRC
jgi:hypothetical protein